MIFSLLPMNAVTVAAIAPMEVVAEPRAVSFDAYRAETQAQTWVVGGMFEQNQASSPQLEERYARGHSLAKTGLFLYLGGTAAALVGTFVAAGAVLSNNPGGAVAGVGLLVLGSIVGTVGFGIMLGGSFGAQSALADMGSSLKPTLGILSIVFYASSVVLAFVPGLAAVYYLTSIAGLVTGLVFYAILKPNYEKTVGQSSSLGPKKGRWGVSPFVAPTQSGAVQTGLGFAATF